MLEEREFKKKEKPVKEINEESYLDDIKLKDILDPLAVLNLSQIMITIHRKSYY